MFSMWNRKEIEAANLAAWITLEGVGEKLLKHQEVGEVALHTRRPMTPVEEAGLKRIVIQAG